MGKKNWIMIKRGLSEDAKHREAMGVKVWLFMHIIDRADWETGIVESWRDADEAADMHIPIRTLRDQRQALEALNYITCIQSQHGQRIIIHEWVNPKNYSGKVLNSLKQGDTLLTPSTIEDDTQGNTQDDIQGSSKDVTPSIIDQVSCNQVSSKRGKPRDPLLDHPAIVAYRETLHLTPNEIQRREIADRVGNNGRVEPFKEHLKAWSMKGWSPKNVTGILESFDQGGIKNGRQSVSGGLTLLQAIQQSEAADSGD